MSDSSQHRHRLLGMTLTAQTVGLVLAVLVVAALVGLAVLDWLEQMA